MMDSALPRVFHSEFLVLGDPDSRANWPDEDENSVSESATFVGVCS